MPILSPMSFEQANWLKDFSFGSVRNCDDDTIQFFLHDLSRAILNSQLAREFPDLVTFGYFCRKANIKKARLKILDLNFRMGWGTVVHVAPSNIPINFAFSLLMGMVSGNSNIVRLPKKTFSQMDLMIQIFDTVIKQSKYKKLSKENIFFQSERNSPRLAELVDSCQGLIVWGGDDTVHYFRSLSKNPRCIEAYFPNRVSSCVLDTEKVIKADEAALKNLCVNFFNDTFLVDQNACSSPNLIFWLGEKKNNERARKKFWSALNEHLKHVYKLDGLARIERSLDVMALAEAGQKKLLINSEYNDIWRLKDIDFRKQNLRFGLFLDTDISELKQVSSLLRGNEQTITTYGIESRKLHNVLKSNLCSVDRIVPVGSALNIGFDWDGRDILSLFSRKTQIG